MGKLLKHLKKYWLLTLLASGFMVAEVYVDLYQPRMMQRIVDEGILGVNSGGVSNLDLVISTGIRMMLIVIAGGLCGIGSALFTNIAGQNYGNDIRKACFEKVMHLSFEQTDRFSIHSASSDNTVTEPWMFSGSSSLIRDAVLLRYRMTPYLYSAEYEASHTGAPIMRALVYEFQNDEQVYDESFAFLCGRDILVANVIEEGAKTKKVYLPAGCKWYDWNDQFTCYEGGQTIEVPVDLATIPMFIREGAIIPTADNQLMSMERDHTTNLHLLLAPGKESSYTLYDDDGVSNDYRRGVCRKTEISMTGESVVNVAFKSEGSYTDFVETVTVEMIRKDRSPFWVALGDQKLEHYLNRRKFDEAKEGWYYSQSRRAVLVKYANPKHDVSLTVSFEDFDLVGM